jgi:hypothetical protein
MSRAMPLTQRVLQLFVITAAAILSVQRPAAAEPFNCLTGAPFTLDALIALGNEGCASEDRQFFDFAYFRWRSLTVSG